MYLQTSNLFQPGLLQNGGKIGLGDVILEGPVAEDHRGVACGFELLVPLGNAEGEQFDVFPIDPLVKTGDQRTDADGTDRFVHDGLGLDGHAQVHAKLDQQIVKDVVLATIRLDVVDAVEKRPLPIVANYRFLGTPRQESVWATNFGTQVIVG